MRASASRPDVYARVTAKIVADLEQGVRPWLKPWNAEHAAGRITRPLRGNGQPYKGVNVLMLWSDAVLKGFAWMKSHAKCSVDRCARTPRQLSLQFVRQRNCAYYQFGSDGVANSRFCPPAT
jgi:hypothetical protein